MRENLFSSNGENYFLLSDTLYSSIRDAVEIVAYILSIWIYQKHLF